MHATKTSTESASVNHIYTLDGKVPLLNAIPFGLQHILAMFVSNIAPILIVGGACGLDSKETALLIQSAMLIAGIGTLVQLFPLFGKIGSGLPIVMGISFTFVSILSFVGAQYGYGAIMGAVLIGGMIEGVLGLEAALCAVRLDCRLYSRRMHAHGGLFFTGRHISYRHSAADAIPHGSPSGCDCVCRAHLLVSATETIGDTSALAASGLGRDVTEKETSGSIACDGFISSLSSVFGCLPITSFSQNVGLVAMTKVVNRFTIATGAVIMILAGVFPMFGALLATLPDAVLGGCTIMMFGTIVVSGLQMISKCGFSQRNTVIAALSLSIGLGFTQCADLFAIFPQMVQTVFAQNCVAVVFVVAIVLNLILPQNMEAEHPAQSENAK